MWIRLDPDLPIPTTHEQLDGKENKAAMALTPQVSYFCLCNHRIIEYPELEGTYKVHRV